MEGFTFGGKKLLGHGPLRQAIELSGSLGRGHTPVFSKCALISVLLLRTICFRMKRTKIPNSLLEKSLSI